MVNLLSFTCMNQCKTPAAPCCILLEWQALDIALGFRMDSCNQLCELLPERLAGRTGS